MKFSKGLHLTILSSLMLTLIMFYGGRGMLPDNPHHQDVETRFLTPDMIRIDPVMNLLGKRFQEIKLALGEPDEEGYSELPGPHYFMIYRYNEGFIRFDSSDSTENRLAVSILFGVGQEVLGAKVGMLFLEINDVLGPPSFGPELGMDNLYYMGYFFGESKDQAPEIFLSFAADSISSRTVESFLKWEGFNLTEGVQNQNSRHHAQQNEVEVLLGN